MSDYNRLGNKFKEKTDLYFRLGQMEDMLWFRSAPQNSYLVPVTIKISGKEIVIDEINKSYPELAVAIEKMILSEANKVKEKLLKFEVNYDKS